MCNILAEEFAASDGLDSRSGHSSRADVGNELISGTLCFMPRGGFGFEFINRPQALFLLPLLTVQGISVRIEQVAFVFKQRTLALPFAWLVQIFHLSYGTLKS